MLTSGQGEICEWPNPCVDKETGRNM
jgi:hypothetical protein